MAALVTQTRASTVTPIDITVDGFRGSKSTSWYRSMSNFVDCEGGEGHSCIHEDHQDHAAPDPGIGFVRLAVSTT